MTDSHRDPHDVLGIPSDADPETVRRAYRRLAARYHPDRHGDDPAVVEQFKAVNSAYEELTKPGGHRRRHPPSSPDASTDRDVGRPERWREVDPVEQRRRDAFERHFEELLSDPPPRFGFGSVLAILSSLAAMGIALRYGLLWVQGHPFAFDGTLDTETMVAANFLSAIVVGFGLLMIWYPVTLAELTLSRATDESGVLAWLIRLGGWFLLLGLPTLTRVLSASLSAVG